jgi:GMP synthase-like glutamine amidotransferase
MPTIDHALSPTARQRFLDALSPLLAACGCKFVFRLSLIPLAWHLAALGVALAEPPADDVQNASTIASQLFGEYPKLRAESPPTVVLVSSQSLAKLNRPSSREQPRHAILRLKGRLEETSGLPCVAAHATQIVPQDLDRPNVVAIVLAAEGFDKEREVLQAVARLIRQTHKPLLAVSDGVRALCRAYSDGAEDAHQAPSDTDAPERDNRTKWLNVRIGKRDPLFADLSDQMLMPQTEPAPKIALPGELELLAGSKDGAAVVVKHKTRPIYAVQFRPQLYDYVRTDGRAILGNFFRIAGVDVDRTVPAYLGRLRTAAAAKLHDLFDAPERLRTADHFVVCGIDMEDPALIDQREKEPRGRRYADKLAQFRSRMRELSGMPCMVVHYTQIARSDFDNPSIRAILIMGQAGDTIKPLTRQLVALIRGTDKPMLGLCRGHQLIAEAYGATVAPMRRLRPDEKDPNPQRHPGFYKESGFMSVEVREADPLLAGCGRPPVFKENHFCEVEQLPSDFVLLASNPECRIEAMRHPRRLLYGVQFHPEGYDRQHPDGRILLDNFFRMAGLGRP